MKKKGKKDLDKATRASVKKEMAKPRMAKSARLAELNLDLTRTSEEPRVTMPGSVHKQDCPVSTSKPAGKGTDWG